MPSHEPDLTTAMPLAFGKIFGTDADWGYHSVCVTCLSKCLVVLNERRPQRKAAQRELYLPSGKILGGCR